MDNSIKAPPGTPGGVKAWLYELGASIHAAVLTSSKQEKQRQGHVNEFGLVEVGRRLLKSRRLVVDPNDKDHGFCANSLPDHLAAVEESLSKSPYIEVSGDWPLFQEKHLVALAFRIQKFEKARRLVQGNS